MNALLPTPVSLPDAARRGGLSSRPWALADGRVDGVDVYLCQITAHSVAACDRLVSRAEVARAANYLKAVDARRSIVAHGVKRWVLSRVLNLPPAQLCFGSLSAGKPVLDMPDAPHFSLSHSGDWVALAVSLDAPIGVDVEFLSDNDHRAIYPRVLGGEELGRLEAAPHPAAAFISCWTQKEAVLKATGQGISIDLRDVCCSATHGQTVASFRGKRFEVMSWPWHAGTASVASEQALGRCRLLELRAEGDGQWVTLDGDAAQSLLQIK